MDRTVETLFLALELGYDVPLRLEVTVDGPREAISVLEGALQPEHADGFPGVDAVLERESDQAARLVAEGEDVPSVRAWMNAHLSWIRTIEDVLAVDAAFPREVS